MSAASLRAALFIDRSGLCERWGISRATSYRLERDGFLPRPVHLGRGISRWPLAEIEALERRAADDRVKGSAS